MNKTKAVLAALLLVGQTMSLGFANEADKILQAMQHEENCNESARLAVLNTIDPQGSPAIESVTNSLLGRVYENQKWFSISESQSDAKNAALARYYKKRDSLELTVSNHLELANYCIKQKLFNQARGHLEAILVEQPDNANLRALLGYRKLGDNWVSPRLVAELNYRLESQAESMKHYWPIFEKIIADIQSAPMHRREAILAQFNTIEGEDVVPAIEQLAFANNLLTTRALDWLIEHDSVATSKSLLRVALLHSDSSLKIIATKELSERPFHDFVPEALAMLSTDYAGSFVPLFDRRGRPLGVRQLVSSERFDMNQLQIIDKVGTITRPTTGFARNRTVLRPGASAESLERFAAEEVLEQLQRQTTLILMQQELMATQQQLTERNNQIRANNERISAVLSTVASTQFEGDERKMWEWWDEYNYNEYQQGKPTYSEYNSFTSNYAGYSQGTGHECFVAGTKVTTKRGLVAIEKVRTGDEVLTRNLQTAALEWKPVITPTQRPARDIVVIKLENDTFECTEGHLFWVAGAGWISAKHLQEGQVLHGAESPSTIQSVSFSQPKPTYNLSIADNSNYFVGQSKVLSHDVTMRGPERQPTPGYAFVFALKTQKLVSK